MYGNFSGALVAAVLTIIETVRTTRRAKWGSITIVNLFQTVATTIEDYANQKISEARELWDSANHSRYSDGYAAGQMRGKENAEYTYREQVRGVAAFGSRPLHYVNPPDLKAAMKSGNLTEAVELLRRTADVTTEEAEAELLRRSQVPSAWDYNGDVSTYNSPAIQKAVRGRNKIQAIKMLREATAVGLKDALDEINRRMLEPEKWGYVEEPEFPF